MTMSSSVAAAFVLCCLISLREWIPAADAIAYEDTSRGSVSMEKQTGEDIYLPCQVSGRVRSYKWKKDNVSVDVTTAMREHRMHVLENEALLILNSVEDDSGLYRCSSSSGGRSNVRVYTLSVRTPGNADDTELECGYRRSMRQTRVVNGREFSRPGLFPWMALLWHKRTNQPVCGGALLNHRFVVTAAHCLLQAGHSAADIEVRLGKHEISTTETHERISQIAEAIPHPSYVQDTYDSDILLLRLAERVEYTDYIIPICLPNTTTGGLLEQASRTGTVAGWGKTSRRSREDFTDVLSTARLTIKDQETCEAQHRDNAVTGNMFCALGTGRSGTRDTCDGDDGGPFVARDPAGEDRSYLVGIVSWGLGCGRLGSPGVNTRVSRYIPWIRQNIDSGATCRNGEPSRIKALETKILELTNQLRAIESPVECGYRRQSRGSSRIVGGHEVRRPGQFPWMALLLYKNTGKPFCGGALLNLRYVVTAAHCFEKRGTRAADVEVRLGEYNISSSEGHEMTFNVARIIQHPHYDGDTLDSDILLLELEGTVVYSDYIVPVCLASREKGERMTEAGTIGVVAGWGETSEGSGIHTDVLRKARVTIQDQYECGVQHRSSVTQRMFCAYGSGRGGTRDACQGDSGGPFVVEDPEDDGRSYLIGIISWGVGCARENLPGVYTRVNRFRDWIRPYTIIEHTCRENLLQAREDLETERSKNEALESQVRDMQGQMRGMESSGPEIAFVEQPIPCRDNGCGHVGGYRVSAECDRATGHCRCDSLSYSATTCLPKGGSCSIRLDDLDNIHALADTSQSSTSAMYSCLGGLGGDAGEVHVLAVHEGGNNAGSGNVGEISVTVTIGQDISTSRPVILVLSNDLPINWNLDVPEELDITKVLLISHNTVLSSVVVRRHQISGPVPVEMRGRNWPRGYGTDNGNGRNTAGMLQRLAQLYGDVTSFAGTYRADSWNWTLPAPRTVQDPSTHGEREQGGVGVSTDRWTRRTFRYDRSWTSCNGEQYVRMRDIRAGQRGKYVGAVLCTNDRYKLFMADDLSEEFKNIADGSGHGSDHCQFVLAADESDFNSDGDYFHAPLAQGYFREGWNEGMLFGRIGGGLEADWTGRYYPKWYECGVRIP